MAERRLLCALVRMCDIRTANTAVSICLYILTDIYENERLTGDQKVAGLIPAWGSETFF